jgi:NADPH:quinone reductase-like Zn-dependent oxidoreductase
LPRRPASRRIDSPLKAILIEKSGATHEAQLRDVDESNLPDGEVTVRVDYSTVNYKDGLAITGKAPVVRKYPMVPGIDFSGTVESSESPQWKVGDKVILNGWGVGEAHWGGLAQRARVKGQWLVALPASLASRDAMADLPATVAPFILRGVTLYGIDSVMAPAALRQRAWSRLAKELDRAKLGAITAEIALADAIPAAANILAGRVRGRVVVDVNR